MANYRFIISFDPEKKAFVARAPELVSCTAEAPTRAEALAALEEEVAAAVENITAQGERPPVPLEEQQLDGKLNVKVTPELHRELLFLAQAAEVELDLLLTELLTRSVGYRRGGGGRGRQRQDSRGRGQRRDPAGQRYHDIMENRADFIEYVRRLESGGGGGGGRGGRGRRGNRDR